MNKKIDHPKTAIVLISILLAVFVVPTSISGTAIALPFIGADLSANLTSLQWVVNSFNLTFACFTLLWGSFADNFGHKKSFIVGATIYTVASLLSAMSISPLMLDIARGLAGVGGAAIFSCGSAILIKTFDGEKRTKAFAFFGTTAGIGITFGPTISGFLLDLFNWRAIFILHTAVLAVVILMTPTITKDNLTRHQHPFDKIGSIIFTTSLFLLMFSISESAQWGWLNMKTLILLGVSFLSGVIFVMYEKSITNPVLNLTLLKNKKYVGLILVPVVASFSFVTLLTYYPSYLIGVMQFSPSYAGIIMITLTVPVLFCPLLAGKIVSSGVSAISIIFISLILMIFGGILLFLVGGVDGQLYLIGFALFMIGAGMGLTAGLVDGLALSCVEPHHTGMAAGLLNTLRLGSEAIAVVLYGSLLTANLNSILPDLLIKYNSSIDVIADWINSVASGNLTAPLSDVATNIQPIMLNDIITSYHSAFNFTLAILTIISTIICLFSIFLLKRKNVPIN
ncbi:MFS transporter [Snodgrassella gandavensis]|uniref:MFS transporter n=1 Tax=Snodgrassella gandavensis TaxID=2946698 RepID=UPI001EF6E7CC|nr:MFS transporter [Snodgrassella gandavensis]